MGKKFYLISGLIFFWFIFSSMQAEIILYDGYHQLKAKTPDGLIIELQDGSYFKVYSADSYRVKEWEEDTILKLSPAYWSRYADFYLTNIDDGYYIRADYFRPPLLDHPKTYIISHVDNYYGEVEIRDSTSKSWWQIDEEDIPLIENWRNGDTIVVGLNHGWFSFYYKHSDHILLNYDNMGQATYVNAKKTA